MLLNTPEQMPVQVNVLAFAQEHIRYVFDSLWKFVSIWNKLLSNIHAVLLTFKQGGNVACRGQSSNAAVPDCSGATSTRIQILIL